MNKKQIREFFGHRFPAPTKKPSVYNLDGLVIFVDRSQQVTKIATSKSLTNTIVEQRFNDYTGEEWLQRMNWTFKGQPISLAQGEIVNMFGLIREKAS